MKVKAIQKSVSDIQRKELGMEADYNPEWQVTIGNEYIVYAMSCIPNSKAYGKATLYEIIDDHHRLLPMPACLFEIIDPRPSKYWVANYKNLNFSFNPVEFIENPFFTEQLLDREEDAMRVFVGIKNRFESER